MSDFNQKGSPLLEVVYAQVKTDHRVELLPLRLYADGSLQRN